MDGLFIAKSPTIFSTERAPGGVFERSASASVMKTGQMTTLNSASKREALSMLSISKNHLSKSVMGPHGGHVARVTESIKMLH